MRRELLEVEHLRTGPPQRRQQAALAATCRSMNNNKTDRERQNLQSLDDPASIRAIPTLESRCVPAHFPQDMGHGARALAAAPAVHQRFPVLRFLPEMLLDMQGDVFRDQRGAEFFRVERRYLLVEGADVAALRVVEHRRGAGAGDM